MIETNKYQLHNAKLYNGTKYDGRMLLVGKECAVHGIDNAGDYLDIYEPSHIDDDLSVICFYKERRR